MKNKFIIATFLSIFLLMVPNVHAMNARAYINDNQTVDKNKTWTLVFTGSVGFDDATKQGITVTDSKGNLVDASLEKGTDTKTILVNAPQEGYIPGQSYILNIGHKVHSSKGKALKNEYKVHFNIGSNTNIVTFKDKNLEQIVRNKINKPSGDILKSDVENIIELSADGSVQDISGIENLIGLQELSLGANQLNDISALKNLTNLRILNLQSNKITDINPLKGLIDLHSLYLDNNEISDISALRKLINLKDVRISRNQIKDVDPLKELTNLQTLYLSSNQIIDISSLAGLTNLKDLRIGNNKISDISSLSGLINLQDFRFGNNCISDISALKGLVNIQLLGINDNHINDISVLKYLINLETLYLHNNQISDVSALSKLYNLKELILSGNYELTDISVLDGLSKLQGLVDLHKEVTINSKIKEIISKVIRPEMSDLEKEKALHDYVVLNTKYDYDNYLKNTIPDDSYSEYGALIKGMAVCAGYARAMNLLLNRVGIETIVVNGYANGVKGWEGHAWNIVKINDKYYHLDVTWDDPVPDVEGRVKYDYFNISDNQISKDHKWDTNFYPKCINN